MYTHHRPCQPTILQDSANIEIPPDRGWGCNDGEGWVRSGTDIDRPAPRRGESTTGTRAPETAQMPGANRQGSTQVGLERLPPLTFSLPRLRGGRGGLRSLPTSPRLVHVRLWEICTRRCNVTPRYRTRQRRQINTPRSRETMNSAQLVPSQAAKESAERFRLAECAQGRRERAE